MTKKKITTLKGGGPKANFKGLPPGFHSKGGQGEISLLLREVFLIQPLKILLRLVSKQEHWTN
jgi:hypothetical protein